MGETSYLYGGFDDMLIFGCNLLSLSLAEFVMRLLQILE